MSIVYDPFSDAARANPFGLYKALRDEAPVYWCEGAHAWVISRYEDVRFVLTHTDLFSSDAMATAILGIPPGTDAMTDPHAREQITALAEALPFGPGELAGGSTLITADPPKHDAMRQIVNRGFSPRRIAAWEGRVRSIADGLMEKLRAESRFDLVSEFAVPLPMTVIIEMLGVEPEHREHFKRWTDGVIAGATGSGRSAGVREGGFARTMGEFCGYLSGVAQERRERPRDDLISLLVQSGEESGSLTPAEMVLFALVLLVAGNETTTNLIGNTGNALLDHPEQLELVCADPGLVPGLVEESLRFVSPVQFLFRRAREDVEIAGTRLPENSIVAALLGSANRDERQFPEPDTFDLTRDCQGHLAFGYGTHFCLGSSLARLEARIALEALVRELPLLQRGDPQVEYIDSYLVRGPKKLELVRKA